MGPCAGRPTGAYTGVVHKVAADTRCSTRDRVLAMTADERLALAFALGEDDLRLYMAVAGVERQAALARLRRTRQLGRTPSVACGPDTAPCPYST